VWKSFFNEYLPEWDLRLCRAEEILKERPEHVLFPGGSGSAFYRRLGPVIAQEVIDWVHKGGSYIGVCAGAYLAANHLKITPLTIPDKAWERGLHDTLIENKDWSHIVNYHNGPIFEEANGVEVWARFRSNFLAEGGYFPMEGSPAITYNRYGRGQVSLFSPHLEKSSNAVKTELMKLFEYIDARIGMKKI
jgi:glutamine amidotransferase-like uncharacterized protein